MNYRRKGQWDRAAHIAECKSRRSPFTGSLPSSDAFIAAQGNYERLPQHAVSPANRFKVIGRGS